MRGLGESGRQLRGDTVDPGTDRRFGVVFQQVEVGEDFDEPPTGRKPMRPRSNLRERHAITGPPTGHKCDQGVEASVCDLTAPIVGGTLTKGAGERETGNSGTDDQHPQGVHAGPAYPAPARRGRMFRFRRNKFSESYVFLTSTRWSKLAP